MTKIDLIRALRSLPDDAEVWVAIPGLLDVRDQRPYTAISPLDKVEVDMNGDIVLEGDGT